MKWKFWLIGLGVAVIAGSGIFVFTSSKMKREGREVDWRLLGELDYISGQPSPEVSTLKGQKVRIPGFMVPLDDNMKKVTEFLLVPSPQACIHVPAPPPNQMIYVRMKSRGVEVPYGPIWVQGVLNLAPQKSMYGEASYELEGELIEPYN